MISFIDDWLDKKIITISLQEKLGMPATLKDAISVYHQELRDFKETK